MTSSGSEPRTALPGPVAGAIGGLAGGALVSLAYLGLEKASGEPSELIRLGRNTASAMGSPYRHQNRLPAPDEQVRYQAIHLILSTLMGSIYVAARRLLVFRGTLGGGLYGASYYGLFWGLIGPKLGLMPPPHKDTAGGIALKLGLLSVFGCVAALVANRLSPGQDHP